MPRNKRHDNKPAGLKEVREDLGLSQEEVAGHVGVSHQTISMWERGERKPRIGRIEKLSEILGIPTEEILKTISG